jgi:hypothetical protein
MAAHASFVVGVMTIEHRPEDPVEITIGKNVLIRRLSLNMTQTRLGYLAARSPSTVARVERGWPCYLETLENLAEGLGCRPSDLRKRAWPTVLSTKQRRKIVKILTAHGGPLRLDIIHDRLGEALQVDGRFWRKSFRAGLEEMVAEGKLVAAIRWVYGLPS